MGRFGCIWLLVSKNLTHEAAKAVGASVFQVPNVRAGGHPDDPLVLSSRTRGLVGATEAGENEATKPVINA